MPTPRSLRTAISLINKETTFGTAIADGSLLKWIPVTEADFAKIDQTFRTDDDEINGYAGATEHQLESKMGSLTRKMNASVEVIASLLALQLGNVTTTGSADPWSHSAAWPNICTLSMPSLSFVEGLICSGATATQWLYKGMVIDSQTIEVNGKGAVIHTVNFKTDGSETAKAAFVFPTTPEVLTKLLGSHLVLQLGPPAGLVDISSLIRSFKITINSSAVVPPNISSATLVPEFQFGDKSPSIEVDFVIKADKSHAIYGYFQGQTSVKLVATFNPAVSPVRDVALTMTRGIIDKADPQKEGSETRLAVHFAEEYNTTDVGPAKFVSRTGVPAYLVAA